MNQFKVSAKRHLAKTVSYRIISTLVGFLIMWKATGSVKFGAAFGVAELIYKPVQYYIHERVWYKYIRYGLIESKKNSKPKKLNDEEPIIKTEVPKKTKRLNYSSNR